MRPISKIGAKNPSVHPMRRYRRTILVALSGLVLLAISVGVWQSRSTNDGAMTRRSDLQKLPEEHLFYPGAMLLGSSGSDYEWGVWGSNPASSGHIVGADASKDEILAFYDRELADHGWQRGTIAGVGSDETTVAVWRKDGLALRIGFLRKNDPQNPAVINNYQAP